MSLKTTLTLLAAHASASSAAALGARASAPTWGDCPKELAGNATAPVKCATFPVPLDYSSPNSSETLDLGLLRVPAVREPKKGSVLVNFGGPGVGVVDTLASRAKLMLATTGGHYDIIGWDPRGTEDTLTFSCFEDPAIRSAMLTFMTNGGNSTDLLAAGTNWAAVAVYLQACSSYEDSAKKGPLIGTSFTARDAMQIVDAVEDDGMLRYMGFSYGTLLGASLAVMFPDRIDRMVLDGVLNAHQYYGGFDYEMNADSDATMDELIKRCFDVPDNCALAHDDNTPEKVTAEFWSWFHDAKYHPIALDSIFLSQASFQSVIRPMLYNPSSWPTVAGLLDGILTANSTAIGEGIAAISALLPAYAAGDGIGNDSPYGIHGADKARRSDSLEDFLPVIDEFEDTSALIGTSMALGQMRFAQWPFVASERLSASDFDKSTKTHTPILFVGNSFDPATPLRSAYNMSASFEGSVVVEHGGVGHCSWRHPSTCTADVVQKYFMEGTLPEKGTKCEPTLEAYEVPVDMLPIIIEHFDFEDL